MISQLPDTPRHGAASYESSLINSSRISVTLFSLFVEIAVNILLSLFSQRCGQQDVDSWGTSPLLVVMQGWPLPRHLIYFWIPVEYYTV